MIVNAIEEPKKAPPNMVQLGLGMRITGTQIGKSIFFTYVANGLLGQHYKVIVTVGQKSHHFVKGNFTCESLEVLEDTVLQNSSVVTCVTPV